MKEISIGEIPGVRLGNAQNPAAATGCTVVLCEAGATALAGYKCRRDFAGYW